MFQTERMRKLRIISLDQYSASIVHRLHEQGIVQIEDISERIQQNPEWANLLKPSKVTPLTSKISSLLMKASGIVETFDSALSEKTGIKDMVMSFVNPVIPDKKEIEELNAENLVVKAESLLNEVESQTKVIEGQIATIDSEISELNSNKSLAEKLINFDIDLALLNDTEYTSTIVGRIDVESALKFKEEANKLTDKLLILDDSDLSNQTKSNKTKSNKKDKSKNKDKNGKKNNDQNLINIIVISLKENKDEIFALLRSFDFEKYDINNIEGTPSDVISNSDSKLKELEKEKSNALAQLKKVAEKYDDDVLILKEQLEIEKERNEIFATFGETDKTNMLEAWVPLKDVDKAKDIIERASEGHSVVEIEDVGKDDKDVPVLQNNHWYAKPYEVIVGMYSPLKYREIDPTILVAIMLPFFFGFNLTDAFYGAIVSIMGFIIYRGIGKVNPTLRSFGLIFITCGIWAIILGLLTGGLIGDFVPRFLGFNLPTVIPAIDAFKQPQNILIIAISIGIIYTNLGFVLGAINNWRYGDKKEAISSQIVWFVFEAGLVLLALGFLMPSVGMIGMIAGGVLILVSIGLLVWGGGAYGLMDIFSYMGDILSYARLLALCLATGGIAMTVNILTGMMVDMVPFVGIIIAIFVFIGGHLINFLFQILGAFVNALRLHYVEFFAQFFMGGENKFNPFSAKRNFTKLRKEQN
ncbi:MAG: V-type ATP synthase subunit I [Methanobrevibacter sp.]|jgi:V/A-type H+-transporting ATPase subunit I|nr:V-type ATP synthase subunit I [Methanobrevibacter sp.]